MAFQSLLLPLRPAMRCTLSPCDGPFRGAVPGSTATAPAPGVRTTAFSGLTEQEFDILA